MRTFGLSLLAAGVVLGAAACGAAPDPLANLSASAISARAVADTEAAASMHVAGQGTSGGQTMSFDLTVTGSKGCSGTVTESKAGSFKLVVLGTSMWVAPGDEFYKAEAARGAVVPLAALHGKYLRETPGKTALGSFGSMCQLNPLLTAFKGAAAKFSKGPASTVGGVRVVRLSGGPVSMDVTDTAAPRVVSIDAPGARYSFSQYGTAAPVSAPPASQVTSGAPYGL